MDINCIHCNEELSPHDSYFKWVNGRESHLGNIYRCDSLKTEACECAYMYLPEGSWEVIEDYPC